MYHLPHSLGNIKIHTFPKGMSLRNSSIGCRNRFLHVTVSTFATSAWRVPQIIKILADDTTPGQSEPGSNDNYGGLYTPDIFRS